MAPKKGTKRPAPATSVASSPKKGAAASSPKKKGKADPMNARMIELIEMAEFLPDAVRNMLSAMVPGCLGMAKEDRLETQEMGVKMIGEVVDGVKAAKQEAVDAAVAAVVELEASKSGLGGKAEGARSCVVDAAATLATKKAALAECDAAAKAASQAHAEKVREQKAGDAATDALGQDKAKFEAAISEEFKSLSEGQTGAEANKSLKKLMPLIASLGLDQSLMTVGPSALTKPPAERGPFDTIVMEQLAKGLDDRVGSLAAQLEEGGPANARRAAETITAQAAAEAAKAARDAAQSEAVAAQQADKVARDVLRDAEAALNDFEPRMKKAVQERDAMTAALKDYVSCHMECFFTLRDKSNCAAQEMTGIEGEASAEGIKA